MYPTRVDIDIFFGALGKRWNLSTLEIKDGVEYTLSKDDRTAAYRWEQDRPEEIFFALCRGNVCDLDDWTEMLESEKFEALFEYIELITDRYLEKPTRIAKKWKYFGYEILQYQSNDKWNNIRSPT